MRFLPRPRLELRQLGVLAACAAGATLTWVLLYKRLDAIGAAMGSIGVYGFAAMTGLHLVLIGLLGAAWSMLARGTPFAGVRKFIWGRLMRDSAAEALPLSQLGGYVLGARALHLFGVPGVFAAASTVVDLAVELAARLPYTIVGLGLLAWFKPGEGLVGPALLAAISMAALAGLFAVALTRGPALLGRIGPRLAPRWAQASGGMSSRLRLAIEAIQSRRGSLGRALLIHSIAWMLSGLELWLPFHFMSADLGLGQAIAIDSLVSGLRSFGFFVPGALGVQEGAYVVACAMFGISPAMALAASLLRRGRDIAIAIPTLATWQVLEGRRAWRDTPVLDLAGTVEHAPQQSR